jgi:hypothetical protein
VVNRPQRVRYTEEDRKGSEIRREATEEDRKGSEEGEAYRVIYFGNDLYYSQRSPQTRIRINKCK